MSRSVAGMNVLVFITDQERAIQHFPKGWADENLTGLSRLQRNGLTCSRAFCNPCMCSPSRATLLTVVFPAQHGVKYRLEEDMDPPTYPQVELPKNIPNLATVMKGAGYSTPYKGNFHLVKPANPNIGYVPEAVNQYGFERWNPPDAGANQDPSEYGGGKANHDANYIYADGAVKDGNEGVIAYLRSDAARQGPFCLVVSLVNPHDVLAYPSDDFDSDYGNFWLRGDIERPPSAGESLDTKPSAQRQFRRLIDAGFGGQMSAEQQTRYVNFYGNLIKASDQYLVQVLNQLDAQGLTDNTLIIRTADHGKMGMAHGGQRQKNFNFYEESIRVPRVFSNPTLYTEPRASEALVSHVDLLPALATLFGSPESARAADWQGVDYSAVILDPKAQGPRTTPFSRLLITSPARPFSTSSSIQGRRTASSVFVKVGTNWRSIAMQRPAPRSLRSGRCTTWRWTLQKSRISLTVMLAAIRSSKALTRDCRQSFALVEQKRLQPPAS